jgi:hypothetical protein
MTLIMGGRSKSAASAAPSTVEIGGGCQSAGQFVAVFQQNAILQQVNKEVTS